MGDGRRATAKGVLGGVVIGAAAASVASAAIVGIPAIAAADHGQGGAAAARGKATSKAKRSPGVLSGTRRPTSRIGIAGDFYIDTAAMAIYGPKKGRAWGKPTSLRGARGPAGAAGTGATGVTVDLAHDNWMVITADVQFRMTASCGVSGDVAIGARWRITDVSMNLIGGADAVQVAEQGPASDLSGYGDDAWSMVATWSSDPSIMAANAMIDLQPLCVEGTLVRH